MENVLVPRAGYPFSVVRIRGFERCAWSVHPEDHRLSPACGEGRVEGAAVVPS